MKEKVSLGVIGAGYWGEQHLKAYQAHPGAKVVAVCDLDEDRANEVAKKYDVDFQYQDYDRMLSEREEIDAVSIVTPDHLHKEPAVACLRAGKHLLIEKPLASTYKDAQEIVQAAKENDREIMVEFNSRWAQPIAIAQRLVKEGSLGRPIHGFMRFSNSVDVPLEVLSWSSKTSVLVFVGCLLIDAARWILGDEVVSVYATTREGYLREEESITTPDCFQSILEFRKGTSIVMENSWILPKGTRPRAEIKFELVGSKESIKANLSSHGAIKRFTQQAVEFPSTISRCNVMGEEIGSVTRCINSFVDSLIKGEKPIVNGEDGLIVNRVIEKIYESARTNQPVDLEY